MGRQAGAWLPGKGQQSSLHENDSIYLNQLLKMGRIQGKLKS